MLQILLVACMVLGAEADCGAGLDPQFVNAFEGLPKETKAALEEIENEQRSLCRSHTTLDFDDRERSEMIAALVVSHHQAYEPRIPSLFQFVSRKPDHHGIFKKTYDQQVREPCEKVLQLHKDFEQSLEVYCGPERLNCESDCMAGLFLDYYETCRQLLRVARYEQIYTYSKLLTHKRNSRKH